MKKIFLLIFSFTILQFAKSQLATTYWQQQVNYTIDVSLNDNDHTLDGYEIMEYINNSPDTLHFIWMHLWPNAYKNDQTAFSDQQLENGSTQFYFSDNDKHGYINRLNFKVNNTVAKMEDHPQHQDIIKIILPQPLAPKNSCKIETHFHEKIPSNFSRGGHIGQSYQITQWYPKPAVYDRKGWHPMPYLDQGEFYSEFGNYKVQISLPTSYIVASTGILTDSSFDKENKTLNYQQNNVHDFAWFADKNFIHLQDTLQLLSGKTIHVNAFYLPDSNHFWKNSISFIKNSIRTRSKWLGEYPYDIATAIEQPKTAGGGGGMEYPTITSIATVTNEYALERVLEHEIGHNWNYGILATNERDHPWMDEGINRFYDFRYLATEKISTAPTNKNTFIGKRLPTDKRDFALQNILANHTDQAIENKSEIFSNKNYPSIVYTKTAHWLQYVESILGTTLFDSCMQQYYIQWKFKHPYPEDFKKVFEDVSHQNSDAAFSLLNTKGNLPNSTTKKDTKFASFFSFKDTDKHHYIFAAPAVGFNMYDKLMLGAAIHNYTLPAEKFQFFVAPLYSTAAKQINGIARVNYHWYPHKLLYKIEPNISFAKFSTNQSLDTSLKKMFENFSKIVPSIKFYFNHTARSTTKSWIDIRTYLIYEKNFSNWANIAGSDSSVTYPVASKTTHLYINQISFNLENNRVLYPYNYQLQLQQGEGFYRVNFTGNYLFNYAKGGRLKARLFAAKFGYIGAENYSTSAYQPKLLGGTGTDDYTYNDYFLGRSASASNPTKPVANQGIAAQQIMIDNTGGLKFRFDQYGGLQGQSDKWIAAINLNTTLPNKLLPPQLPITVFFDAGTYADVWKKGATGNRFIYTGGLQLSLFKNILNIYVPFIYNKEFKATLKSDPGQNTFSKKIFFSVDLQQLTLKKINSKFSF